MKYLVSLKYLGSKIFLWSSSHLALAIAQSPISSEEEEIQELMDELGRSPLSLDLEIPPAPPIPDFFWWFSGLAIVASTLGFFLLNKPKSRLPFWQKVSIFLLVVIAYVSILDRVLTISPNYFILLYFALYFLAQLSKDIISTILKIKTFPAFFLRYLYSLISIVIIGIILKEIFSLKTGAEFLAYGYLVSSQFAELLLKYVPQNLIALVSGVFLGTLSCFSLSPKFHKR
ncbi:MAG: hypothetical protein AB4290_29775 [Spirulina sp.]